MVQPTAEQVAQRALDLGLLDEKQLRDVWAALGTHSVSLEEFFQMLLRRELMTNYQIERLRKGERHGFFFGRNKEYKIQYLIGAGTFARVFRAIHQPSGRVVAIKALRSRFSENPAHYNLFLREGHVGCTLRHPNIVRIDEVVSDGRQHFLVMEFVEGRNLREHMKVRKRLTPEEATRLTMDIARGLHYAFQHGVTHRDLKLSNVLVSITGQAKIVDFGLAALDDAVADDLPDDLPNTRTIDYAALERATGVRKDDTRSDIYFLGCIYYHLLTGVAPLPETSDRLARLSRNRFHEVIPIRKLDPSVPDMAALVVNKAMSLDPNARYQTPGAMLADLQVAMQRLVSSRAAEESGTLPSGTLAEPTHAVMVVEANSRLQEMLREGLRKAGFRVLMTVDPMRALQRFRQDITIADCALIDARGIGQQAVEVFNEMGEDKQTGNLPVVLLLDGNQRQWAQRASTAAHRVVLTMPVTMKQLCGTLARLVKQPASDAKS
jgi:CheY-like chemotaxis protein